jgi:hypothetical protein
MSELSQQEREAMEREAHRVCELERDLAAYRAAWLAARDFYRVSDLEAAVVALSSLVRDEYPEGYSLAEIARTWGNATPAQLEALRVVDLRQAKWGIHFADPE